MSFRNSDTFTVRLPEDVFLRRAATLVVLTAGLAALLPGRAEGQALEPVLPAGLVAQWTFNETSGTTATDSVGGLVGNLEARGGDTPTFVSGRFGNALYMNGAGDDDDRSKDTPGMLVDITGTGVIDWGTATDWTLMYWLKSDPTYEYVSADTIYSGNYGPDGTFSGDAFQFTATRAGGFNGHYQRYGSSPTVTSSPPAEFEFEAGTPVPIVDLVVDDTWHHYAWSVERSGDTVYYIDGFEVLRQTQDNTGIDFVNATAIEIGFDDFNGSMDDLRFYNRALTQEDMDVLVPPPDPVDTFIWSSGDEGDWNASSSWTPARGGPPNGMNPAPPVNSHVAQFLDIIETATTVVVDSDVSVRRIEFDNANSYSIAGVASVNLIEGTDLEGTADPTRIEVRQGSHQFQAVVNLQTNTSLDVASGSALIFNNQLNLGGNTLTKTGDGELAIRNDSFTGSGMVTVEEGTLSGNGTVGGSVDNSGGTIGPGNSPGILTIDGDLTQGAGGTLAIEIGGTIAGDEFDQLIVNGMADLAGTLSVELIDSFAPDPGMSFEVLTATSITDNGLSLGGPDASMFSMTIGETNILLNFGSMTPDGDLNSSGLVDAEDLNLVLFNWNEPPENLPSEWNHMRPDPGNVVGVAELNKVLFTWNETSSLASGVPEPGSIVLTALAVCLLGAATRERIGNMPNS